MNKETQLLRIGVLGCGPIAQFAHFDACRKARNAELYAICDVADDLRARMAAIHQPSVTYTDYDEMLADPKVDAVIIAVADQFHVPMCMKAIAAKKHVLIEKPLGVTVEESTGLVQHLKDNPLVLQVGNNRRFDPGVMFARDFIQNDIGGLIALKVWYCDSTYRYTMTDNLQPIPIQSAQARRPAGNPKADKQRYFMLTHGSHLVDMARFLGGEIEAVRARINTQYNSHCWFIETEYVNGALGHLELTIPVRGDFEEGFRVYGESGSVNGRLYLPWYHKASDVECFSTKDRQYHRPLGEDSFTYKLQIESFADCIMKGARQVGTSVADGHAAIQAMVAIARSVESGARIRLADVTGGV
jgi:predicted dehydrogenase